MRTFISTLLILLGFFSQEVRAQNTDNVVCVVGNDTIFESSVRELYNAELATLALDSYGDRIEIDSLSIWVSSLDILIKKRLLIIKAKEAHLSVNDEILDAKLDEIIEKYTAYLTSPEDFELLFGFSPEEFRSQYRLEVKDDMLRQMMEDKILEDETVSEIEVQVFFDAIPDSLVPFLDEEVEVNCIDMNYIFSDEKKANAENDLQEMYDLVVSGTKEFPALARDYSSVDNSLFFEYKTSLNKRETNSVINEVLTHLQIGEVSRPFEMNSGYMMTQLHERHDDISIVSCLLILPNWGNNEIDTTIAELNQIRKKILEGTISFEKAAKKWSFDSFTDQSSACVLGSDGAFRIPINMMSPPDYQQIADLKEGEITAPYEFTKISDQTSFYRILYLKKRILPHTANLKDDYQLIADAALQEKRETVLALWVENARKETLVAIKGDYGTLPIMK